MINSAFANYMDKFPNLTESMCHNYMLVIAPGTLGMLSLTSLSQVSKQGWRKAYQECHGDNRNREEPLIDNF